MSINSIVNDSLGKDSFVSAQKPVPPTIIGYVISGADDTALDPAGGQTVLINGSGFQRGATVTFDGTAVAVVTWVSASQLSFTTPAKSAGTYTIYVVNTDGGTAIYIPGMVYSTLPTWSTGAGSLGSYYETKAISNTLTAAGDTPVTYSLVSGSLPTGASLNSSGVISGTAPVDSGSTTYSFTVEAIDAQLQSSTRSFSLTINTDAVTWVNPANGATITLDGTAYSTVLSATSAAGYSISSYTANTLPTGLTLTGNTISGTPSVEGNTTTSLTATASTTNRSGTNTITWVVNLGDANWKYVTTLLSPTLASYPFNDDASTNNFVVTVTGDTKPNNFNPYTPGYYSVNLGASTYVRADNNDLFRFRTGDFTVEFWLYCNVAWTTLVNPGVAGQKLNDSSTGWQIYRNGSVNTDKMNIRISGSNDYHSNAIPATGTWEHWAVTRQSGTLRWFKNGALTNTHTGVTADTNDTGGYFFAGYTQTWGGYSDFKLSNMRIVKGTAVYTEAFTPSTTPILDVSSTSVLLFNSNRIIDRSSNNLTLTTAGTPIVSSANPYLPNSSYSTYGSTYFDGSGDNLSIPSNAAFTLGTSDHTIEFWMYLAGGQSAYATQWKYSSGSTQQATNDYYFSAGSAGGATFGLLLGGGGSWAVNISNSASYTTALNNWTHIAITRSGSTFRLFANGVQVGSSGTYAGSITAQGGAMLIGQDGSSNFTTGYISNFRFVNGTALYTSNFTPPASPLTAIANTSLLTCQTNQPANNNMFLDSSTNNFLVTRAGNTTQGTFSPYGENWSNYFDGNGDYLSLASNAAFDQNTAFTVECWVNSSAGGYFFTQLNSGYLGLSYDASTRKIVVDKSYIGVQITSTNSFAFNQWHHVAMSYNGTTTRLFVNGALEGSAAGGGSASGAELRIGNYNTGSNFYTGYISNLRICKSALYTSNFTPSTTPLQPITNTVLLTCRDPNIIDDSANNFTVTRAGDASVQKFGPFAGTTLPAPVYSAYFDGTGDYLTTAGNTALDMGTGDFTIECFTISNGYSGSQYGRGLWALYPTGNYNSRILVRHSNVGQILGIYGWNGSSAYFGSSGTGGTTNLVVGQWYHVAFVRQSGVFRLYVNGVQEIVISNQTGISLAGSNCFDIGRCQDGSTPDWNGYISNFRAIKGTCLYPDGTTFTPPASPLTAVSGTGILTCRSNTFVDSSSNAIALTVSGTPSPRTATPFSVTYATKQSYTPAVFGGSMYFDGTGDYLSVAASTTYGTLPASGAFTIEGWFYFTDLSVSQQVIFTQRSSTNSYVPYLIWTSTTNIVLYSSSDNGSWNISNNTTIATGLTAGQWYHFAYTRNGNTFRFFVNGVQTYTFSSSAAFTNTGTFNLGMSPGETNTALKGYSSDVRFINGTSLYNANFVPQNQPLTPVTNTTLLLSGTGAGIYDSSEMSHYETVADAKLSHFGPYNGSYYSNFFDGSGDSLSVASNTAFNLGAGDFTVEGWYNFNVLNVQGQELFRFSGSTTYNPFLFVWDNGTMYFRSAQVSGEIVTPFASGMVTGVWYHWAVTRVGNAYTIYRNGVSVATGTSTAIVNENKQVIIGTALNGYVSNFRVVKGTAVYTSAFTPPTTPLTAIANTSLLTCQSNKFVDNSTNNFTITRAGDARVAPQNPFQINSGQSIIFDGTGDYLSYPITPNDDFGSGDFTVECWAYTITTTTGTILYIRGQAGASAYAAFRLGLENNGLFLLMSLNGAAWAVNTGVIGSVPINTWNYIAVTRQSSTVRIFVNGVVHGTTYTASGALYTSGPINYVGALNTGSPTQFLNGYITDLRITKGVARYTTTFTPPSSNHSTK